MKQKPSHAKKPRMNIRGYDMDSGNLTITRSKPMITRPGLWTTLICALLLTLFALNSHSAVLTKNATIDEPTQAMSAWLELHRGDFRIQASPPALWQAWAGLGNLFTELKLTYDSPIWTDRFWNPRAEILWSSQMLYDTPGNDGDRFVNRDREMMLVIGLALGVLIAWWSDRLGGSVAAIVATSLFCFDPNFLGHASLVKGDVAFALVLLSLAFCIWRVGQSATLIRVVGVGLLCGALINIKFTGVIVGPLLAGMLLVRAVLPWPWEFAGHSLRTCGSRILAGFATGVFAAICCFAVTWATYGFRYRVAPSPAVSLDMNALYEQAQTVETGIALKREPTAGEIAAHQPSRVAGFVRWADDRRLLPQAYLAGLMYQMACVQNWPAFLDREIYSDGRLSYFPLATVYKSPVATLVAYGLAVGVLVIVVSQTVRGRGLRGKVAAEAATPGDRAAYLWTIACVVCPCAVFALALLTAHLNIGLRSALPLFPFFEIATGCAAALAWRWRPRLTGAVLILLGIGLALETLCAWPNYIAFFNIAAGGERGGFAHLSDSNLDWGQDLNSLADWQRQHPGVPIYARLFHSVDPAFYGLKYHRLLVISDGPHAGEPASDVPMQHCVLAVSATHLQGLYLNPWEEPFYQRLRETRPIAVLGGGTIFLFEYRPPRQ